MNKEIIHNYSECFFGYNIRIGKDELNLENMEDLWPHIYIERNDGKQNLFFTFPDWFEPIESKSTEEMKYDEALVAFEARGVDLSNIIERAKRGDRGLNICDKINPNIEGFKEQYRYVVEGVTDYSGVGAFILSKDNKETVFYFAINYSPKKRIYYSIDKKKIIFKTRSNVEELTIRVLSDKDRIPCLKEGLDFSSETIKFNKGKASINIPKSNDKFYVDFGGTDEQIVEQSQKYLLICVGNKTTVTNKKNKRVINATYYCPYCHQPITFNKENYKTGMYCDGTKINEFTLYDKNNQLVKNFICCKDSISKINRTIENKEDTANQEDANKPKSNVNVKVFRLLPNNYTSKRNYRIAILGKARSGKTTFISRLLNITGKEDRIQITPKANDFFSYYNIDFASCNHVKRKMDSKSPNEYVLSDSNYFSGKQAHRDSNSFIQNYSISLADKTFVAATTNDPNKSTTNTIRYPFILNVKNQAYVSLYDIAGEDAEESTSNFTQVTKGDDLGLIIIFDLTKDPQVNIDILKNALKNYKDHKDTCPIAIVLTKFDAFEKYFSPNCSCLRGDYRQLYTENLNDSSIIRQIDTASDEIESFLLSKNYDIRKDYFDGFNIKFFGVSAITYTDAMYHEDNSDSALEKNALNFLCSSKRIELPLLWMLHELGEI